MNRPFEYWIQSFDRTSDCLERPSVVRYLNFRDRVDGECRRLEALHGIHLRCGPGCSDCCQVDRTVLPVEAAWLIPEMRKMESAPLPDTCSEMLKNRCVLLDDSGRCRLYEDRPVLCRSHGLPILIQTESESGIAYCDHNFLNRDPALPFAAAHVLDMVDINGELADINREFIVEEGVEFSVPEQRVSLSALMRMIELRTQ